MLVKYITVILLFKREASYVLFRIVVQLLNYPKMPYNLFKPEFIPAWLDIMIGMLNECKLIRNLVMAFR